MGCGGTSNKAGPTKIVVHGDLFSTETRTVLSILDMTEVDFEFKEHKRTKDCMRNLSSAFEGVTDLMYLSKVSPVIEENGTKRVGSGQ